MSRETHVRFCEQPKGKILRLTLLLISSPPSLAPAEIMRRIKGRTSMGVFEEYPQLKKRYWGRHFWARGYFCVTAGELTKEMIAEYLAHHHEEKKNGPFELED